MPFLSALLFSFPFLYANLISPVIGHDDNELAATVMLKAGLTSSPLSLEPEAPEPDVDWHPAKIIDKDKLIDDENELEKIKKADFIISDGDIETLKDYHALNKNVIIYRNRKSKSVDLFYEKGVYTYKYSNELREIINHLEKQSQKKKVLLKLPLLFLILVIIISILLVIYNNHQKELEREEKIRQEEIKKKRLE